MIKETLIFAAGTAIGAAAAWTMLKNKYRQFAEEEISSVKEAFRSKSDKDLYKSDKQDESISEGKDEYETIVKRKGYSNKEMETTVMKKIRPYVIPPEQFDEIDEYDTVTLSYYADGILADETDTPIDNIDSVVGFDSLKTFGRYEDDSVYVRNDMKKCDYEILRDERKYMDILRNRPMQSKED